MLREGKVFARCDHASHRASDLGQTAGDTGDLGELLLLFADSLDEFVVSARAAIAAPFIDNGNVGVDGEGAVTGAARGVWVQARRAALVNVESCWMKFALHVVSPHNCLIDPL
jgi:hypothetical protein